MIDKIKAFIVKMNQYGIPVPMIREPKTQQASVTLTLVVVSFAMVVLSLVGSITAKVKGIDVNNSLELLMISLGAYLGRHYQKGQGISSDSTQKEEPKT
jgi:hypothetical protein